MLALDQGTTGSTAILFGDDGGIRGHGYHEFTQHFPQPGWVEHDPEEIWETTLAAARDALRGETPSAVGITNQRETVVVWDRRTGVPLHRALVWQDRRTAARCRELARERGDAEIAQRTGLVWDPYFSATKIEWLLREIPDVRAKAARGGAVFGTVDAWLIYRLTGEVLATDHTNASRTLLYNIRDRRWDPTLLELFRVPPACLPDVRASSELLGMTRPELFGAPVPVAGVAGDQQAALFGQGCFAPGQAKNTYGTGAFLLMIVGAEGGAVAEAGTGVLTTIACDRRGAPTFAVEGSVFIAGAAIQWLRDGLGLLATAGDSEAMAREVTDTGGAYFVPALVGLGAPHWEADARGTIVGLTRGTTKAHLVRAALEAMAYSTREVSDAMHAASNVTLTGLKVDGGAAANDWLMEFQAHVLGVPVYRPDVIETTAFGAAGLAGLATGVWSDAAEFVGTRTYREFAPRSALPSTGYAGWRRAVDTALFWARR